MHPSRYAMIRGPMIARAPENDEGSDLDLELDDEAPEDDEPEEEDEPDEPDEPDDELDEPDEPPQRAQRKPFAQRVEEVATRKAMEIVQRELAARQPAPQPVQQETREQLRERLANMDGVQLAEYLLHQQQQSNAQLQFQMQETADQGAYASLAQREPIAAKLKDEVEARLADMRRQGTTAPRETILKYLIGERALNNKGRATGKAQRTAAANRDRQTTRPTSGRGDTARETLRGDSPAARAKRLENQSI